MWENLKNFISTIFPGTGTWDRLEGLDGDFQMIYYELNKLRQEVRLLRSILEELTKKEIGRG